MAWCTSVPGGGCPVIRLTTVRVMGMLFAGVMIAGLSGCTNQKTSPKALQTSAKSFWGEFPANADPRVMGKKVADNLLARPEMEGRTYGIIYEEVCVAYGALRFAHGIKDQELVKKLVDRYDGMLVQTDPSEAPRAAGNVRWVKPDHGTAANMIPAADHVDSRVFGTLALECYFRTNDPRYLAIGKKSADDQWANPIDGGLTRQTRWWIDDMFMITAVQVQAYRATKDKVYLDRAATEMAAYFDKL